MRLNLSGFRWVDTATARCAGPIVAIDASCHCDLKVISAGDSLKGLYVPQFGDLDDMHAFADQLRFSSAVALDFSRTGFANPTGMLVLASLIEEAVKDGRVPIQSGITPRDYSSNMGFYSACGLDVPKQEAPGGATPPMPITHPPWSTSTTAKPISRCRQ